MKWLWRWVHRRCITADDLAGLIAAVVEHEVDRHEALLSALCDGLNRRGRRS
jgi:hypothetical protein